MTAFNTLVARDDDMMFLLENFYACISVKYDYKTRNKQLLTTTFFPQGQRSLSMETWCTGVVGGLVLLWPIRYRISTCLVLSIRYSRLVL